MLGLGLQALRLHDLADDQTDAHSLLSGFGKGIRRNRHVLDVHAALLEILQGAIGQGLRLGLHQRLGNFDSGQIGQRFHDRSLVAVAQTLGHFALKVGTDIGPQLAEVAVGNAQFAGEVIVELGQARRLDLAHGDFKFRGLASQLGSVVISRESHRKLLDLARGSAAHTGFEVGQHATFAQHEREFCGGATLEGHAIELAGEVDGDPIAIGGGPLDRIPLGALLAQNLERFVHFCVTHRTLRALERQRGRIAQLNLGVHLENGAETSDRRFTDFPRLDARLTGNAQVVFGQGITEGLVDRVAHHLGLDLTAIRLLDHFHRHFAGPETRHAYRTGHFAQAAFDLLADLGHRHRQTQATFERAGRFKLSGHVLSSLFRSDTGSRHCCRTGSGFPGFRARAPARCPKIETGIAQADPTGGVMPVLVRPKGLEPSRLSAPGPKPGASTDSATAARKP